MNREAFTQKLVRILEKVDAGDLPAKVLEVYVFGSFAWGAAKPHDLDLMVVYEAPGREWMAENAKPWREAGWSELDAGLRAHRKFETQLGYALRQLQHASPHGPEPPEEQARAQEWRQEQAPRRRLG